MSFNYNYRTFEPNILDQLRADSLFENILENGFANIAAETLKDHLDTLRASKENPLVLLKMQLYLLMQAEEQSKKVNAKMQEIQKIIRNSIWDILNDEKYQKFATLDYDFLSFVIELNFPPALNDLLFENRKDYFKEYAKNILKIAAEKRKEDLVELRDSSVGLKVSKHNFEALFMLIKQYGGLEEIFITRDRIQESKGEFPNLSKAPAVAKQKTLNIPKPRPWYSPPGRAVYNLATFGFNVLLSVFTGIHGLFKGSPLKGWMRGMRPIDSIVLPAKGFHSSREAKASLEEKLRLAIFGHDSKNNHPLQFNRFKLKTMDGAEIDTFEISHQDKPVKDQKYIVYFMGNGNAFQDHAKEMVQHADALGCNVIAFNYRGVANSTEPFSLASQGDAPHVRDGLLQIKRLLALGVKPENIMIKGHSLGGYISTQVASICHQQQIPVYLFNDRSLASLPDFVSAAVGIRPARLLAGSGWNQDASLAFRSIPDTHRQHVVAREPKSPLRGNQPPAVDARKPMTDAVIDIEASIHKKITREMKQNLFNYYCQQQRIAGEKQILLKWAMGIKISELLNNIENAYVNDIAILNNDLLNSSGRVAPLIEHFVKEQVSEDLQSEAREKIILFLKTFGLQNAQNHIKNLKMLYKYPKLQLGFDPWLPPQFSKEQQYIYSGRVAHSTKLQTLENIIVTEEDEGGG